MQEMASSDSVANGGSLNEQSHGYPVPSPEMGRSNDYRFVTEYGTYRYGVGSARQLLENERPTDVRISTEILVY